MECLAVKRRESTEEKSTPVKQQTLDLCWFNAIQTQGPEILTPASPFLMLMTDPSSLKDLVFQLYLLLLPPSPPSLPSFLSSSTLHFSLPPSPLSLPYFIPFCCLGMSPFYPCFNFLTLLNWKKQIFVIPFHNFKCLLYAFLLMNSDVSFPLLSSFYWFCPLSLFLAMLLGFTLFLKLALNFSWKVWM